MAATPEDFLAAFDDVLVDDASGDLVIPPEHDSRVLAAMRRQLFFERQRCARLLWPLYSLQRDGGHLLLLVSFFFPLVALVLLARPSWDEPWILRYELERRWRRRRCAPDGTAYRSASHASCPDRRDRSESRQSRAPGSGSRLPSDSDSRQRPSNLAARFSTKAAMPSF